MTVRRSRVTTRLAALLLASVRTLVFFAVVLFCWGDSARPAFAWATCWCEIATSRSDGTYNASQLSLTEKIGKSYNGCEGGFGGQQCDNNLADCSNRCNNACSGYTRAQSYANSLCAQGTVPNGTLLKCYSHVGTQGWQANQTIGTLTNIPAVSNTVCTCPKPWINANNVVGGTTGLDKECKIMVCSPITPGPGTSLPPNGTATNTWPIQWWTWENTLWQWSPVATCITTQVSPAQCKLN